MKSYLLRRLPATAMRYPTCADWHDDGTDGTIDVVDGSDAYVFILWVHELIEHYLCHVRGITDATVIAFDRLKSERDDDDDPGSDPAAPYHREHRLAESVEIVLTEALGVNVPDYYAWCRQAYEAVRDAQAVKAGP